MRIILLTNQVLFINGGAEYHAAGLKAALEQAGHEVEIVAIPCRTHPPHALIDGLVATRLLHVGQSEAGKSDLAIGLRFPAYTIMHPNKVLWIIHQERAAYDLWDTEYGWMKDHPEGVFVREAIRESDLRALDEARLVFANSRNVAGRLERYCDYRATPLYHPPPLADQLCAGNDEGYFFFPSRINALKRQALVLEALSRCRREVRVVFAGRADNPDKEQEFLELAGTLGVRDRVDWRGFVSDAEKVSLYADCRAVIYPPMDEDYGYVTLEAMLASKPVLTLDDSGGPLEFVEHGRNGWVTAPDAESLAAAMDSAWDDPALARRLGAAGREIYDSLGIGWENVIRKLLG